MSDADSSAEPVLLEQTAEGVRVLRMNRPERKNALSTKLTVAILEAFRAAAADDAVRVVALTGQGGAFSSGADLRSEIPTDAKRATGSSRRLDDIGAIGHLVKAIRLGCDKPVIAGIDGIAIGAGLSLALCADIRMASSRARFHPGYARAGTSPDGGLSWTLPKLLGHERAMRFLLELEMVDADGALAAGLVGEVVDADGFDDAFMAYCTKIAAVAPIAARQTKRLVTRVGLPPDLDSHLRDELHYAVRALTSDDGKEAVRAIMQKRKPEFTGR